MLHLDIAGVTFAVALPAAEWQALLAERYAAFLSQAESAAAAWCVTVMDEPSLAFEPSGWIRHDGPVTTFHVFSHAGRFDLAARRAEVSVPAVERAAAGLDRTLAYICMQALPRAYHGLLLHAAGVVLDGAGHVFTGASGTGKTTVARLASGRGEVLSDENVIIRLGSDGPELFSTPFWGHSTPPEMIRRVNRRVPLAAVYVLSHADAYRIERLSPAEAVMALLTTEKVAAERPESAAAWLAVAEHLVNQTCVCRLGFRPAPELWGFLAARE